MVIENHAMPVKGEDNLFYRVQRLRLRGYTSLQAASLLEISLAKVNKLWAPTNRDVKALPVEPLTKFESV